MELQCMWPIIISVLNRTYSCYSSSNTDNFILFVLKMLDNLCDERVHVTRAHVSSDGSLYWRRWNLETASTRNQLTYYQENCCKIVRFHSAIFNIHKFIIFDNWKSNLMTFAQKKRPDVPPVPETNLHITKRIAARLCDFIQLYLVYISSLYLIIGKVT